MTAQTLDAFQVIADLSLRQMLKLLSKETLRKNALAENFDMTRPAVSKSYKNFVWYRLHFYLRNWQR